MKTINTNKKYSVRKSSVGVVSRQIATVLAVASLGVGVSTHVHADEQGSNVQSSEQLQDQTVTSEMVSTAKSDADQATANVTAQEVIVNQTTQVESDASQNVNTIASEYETVKAQTESITPEQVESVKSEISDNEKELASLDTSIASLEDAHTQESKDVDNQTVVVTNVQSEIAKLKEALSQAQVNEQTAKDNLNVSSEQLSQNLTDATTKADNASNKVTTLTEEIKTATASNAKVSDDITKATTDLETAKEEETSAKVDMESAQKAVENATAKLLSDENLRNVLTSEKDSQNTFTVTQAYIDALKAYAKGDTSQETILEVLDAENKALNTYKGNEADKAHIISDINNLTDEETKEINEFVLDLSTQIRKQFGSIIPEVSVGAVKFANRIAELYNEDIDAGVEFYGHDKKAINTAAYENGLAYNKANQLNFYENLVSLVGFQPTPPKTMNDVKEAIYDVFNTFMFGGGEWRHASSIAGLKDINASKVNIAFSISYGKNHLEYHHITVTDFNILSSKYDQTVIPSTKKSTDDLVKEIAKVSATIVNDKDILSASQATLKSKEDNVAAKQQNRTTAENQLATLKSQLKDISALEKELESAQNEVKVSLVNVATAKEALANYSTAYEQRKEAYTNAQKETIRQQTAYKEQLSLLDAELDKLTTMHEKLMKTESEIVDAKAKQMKLQSQYESNKDFMNSLTMLLDKTKLTELEEKLNIAKAQLAQAIQANDVAKSKLDVLKQLKDEKTTIYNNLLAKYKPTVTDDTKAPITEDTKAPITDDTKAPITDDTKAPATDDTKAPATDDTKAPVTADDTKAPATDDTKAPVTADDTKAPVTADDTKAPVTTDKKEGIVKQQNKEKVTYNTSSTNKIPNNTYATKMTQLPNTGDNHSATYTIIGAVMVSAMGFLIFDNRKRVKK